MSNAEGVPLPRGSSVHTGLVSYSSLGCVRYGGLASAGFFPLTSKTAILHAGAFGPTTRGGSATVWLVTGLNMVAVQARIRGPLFALARYPLSSHSPPSASCPPSELSTPTRPPTKVNTEAARRLIKWPASASGLQQPLRSDYLSSHLPRRRQPWQHYRQPSTYRQRPSVLTMRCNRH